MHLISAALAAADFELPAVAIPTARRTLAKRLWRGQAADGTEFGFQVEQPLQNGDTVWADSRARYVIEQTPEAVLAILLSATPEVAAVTGWAIGNLHCPISAENGRILTPDEPGLKQALTRMGIAYTEATEIFRAHRFSEFSHSH
jgi:urease accessory protein